MGTGQVQRFKTKHMGGDITEPEKFLGTLLGDSEKCFKETGKTEQ